MRRLTDCFLVMIALVAPNARAAAINNGSFETTMPAVPAGSFVNFLPAPRVSPGGRLWAPPELRYR